MPELSSSFPITTSPSTTSRSPTRNKTHHHHQQQQQQTVSASSSTSATVVQYNKYSNTHHYESKQEQNRFQKRIRTLLSKSENKVCLDCTSPGPRWATLIVIPSSEEKVYEDDSHTNKPLSMGGFCCLECSGAHRKLGTHVTFVRSVDLDSFKEHEVQSLEMAGNATANSIYEGRLLNVNQDSFSHEGPFHSPIITSEIKPTSASDAKTRETFIRNKYESRLYLDWEMLSKFYPRQDRDPATSESSFATSSWSDNNSNGSVVSDVSQSPSVLSPRLDERDPEDWMTDRSLQLQAFTTSPKTLAMLQKYMKDKKNKRNVEEKRRDRRQFKQKALNSDTTHPYSLPETRDFLESEKSPVPSPFHDILEEDDMSQGTTSVNNHLTSVGAAFRKATKKLTWRRKKGKDVPFPQDVKSMDESTSKESLEKTHTTTQPDKEVIFDLDPTQYPPSEEDKSRKKSNKGTLLNKHRRSYVYVEDEVDVEVVFEPFTDEALEEALASSNNFHFSEGGQDMNSSAFFLCENHHSKQVTTTDMVLPNDDGNVEQLVETVGTTHVMGDEMAGEDLNASNLGNDAKTSMGLLKKLKISSSPIRRKRSELKK